MSAYTNCTDLEEKGMNAKLCGNAFHVTTRAFVKVKNTATNFANDGKCLKWWTQNFWKKNVRIIPTKKFRTGYNPRKRCLATPHPTK